MSNSVKSCPECSGALGKGILFEPRGLKFCQECYDNLGLCIVCEDTIHLDDCLNVFPDSLVPLDPFLFRGPCDESRMKLTSTRPRIAADRRIRTHARFETSSETSSESRCGVQKP